MCVFSRELRGSHDEHEIPGWLFYTGGSTTLLNIGILLETMFSHAKKGFLRTKKYVTDCNWQEVELDKDMITSPKMLGQLEV